MSGLQPRRALVVLGILGVLCGWAVSIRAQMPGAADGGIQMPDPKEMSGIPRPVGDLPNGAITILLIRGSFTNPIANHEVELEVAGATRRDNTDASGHVEFTGLAAGATVKATAVVDGERLDSQEFQVPAQGGIRLMLVATDKAAAKEKAEEAATPPVSGQVVLGGESRIIIEPGDEAAQVYYLLDIVNTARVRVNPPTPFLFDAPRAATSTTVLDGSSPQATVTGSRVRVQGPFKPGTTTVQIACELPLDGGTLQFSQRFPATMEQLAVIAKKAGAMRLISPQLSSQQEMTADDGQHYVAATGGVVPAGAPINVTLEDLPHHSTAPRNTALAFAVGIVLVGLWAIRRPEDPRTRQAARQRLVQRREKLLAELVRLERDRANGRGDPARRAARRAELVAALEPVYAALDDGAGDPAGLTPPSDHSSMGSSRARELRAS